MPMSMLWRSLLAALLVAPVAAPSYAQTDNAAVETPVVIEELVVTARRPGDDLDLDLQYDERLRKQLMGEQQRLRDIEDEEAWRRSVSPEPTTSRITWGYDPNKELQLRREGSLHNLPSDPTRPANLFRAEF
jgi:hypothetical protein